VDRTTPNHRRHRPFAGSVHLLIIGILIMTVAGAPAIARARGDSSYTLVFTRQPANAVADARISSSAYNPPPAGDPVRVTVYDYYGVASGFTGTITLSLASNPGNGTLSGTLQETVAYGRADFPDISIDESGFGYRLRAVACQGCGSDLRGGIIVAQADSGTFDIVDVRKICDAESCESGFVEDEDGRTTAHMETSEGADGDVLLFSVSPGALNCASYTETSSLVTFSVSGLRTKTITVIVPRNQGRSLASYQVCYNSPNRFRNRAGHLVNTGLLPNCAPATSAPPCVVSRAFDGNTVVIVFSAPRGDPKGRV
jgi:hypothetical protein